MNTAHREPTQPLAIRGHIDTRYEMKRAGYKFLGQDTCRKCQQPVERWKTNNSKLLLFEPIAHDEQITALHYRSCKGKVSPRKPAPLEHLLDEAGRLCESNQLRAVILLHEGGSVSCFRLGIPPEDLRNEIITAANKVRDDAMKGEC